MIKTKNVIRFPHVEGIVQFIPTSYIDERGETYTSFSFSSIVEAVPEYNGGSFFEDKVIVGKEGAFRGLHADKDTWKVISCMHGSFYLYLVDTRDLIGTSPDYGATEIFMDPTRGYVLVPPWVANGHLGLSKDYVFHYKWSKPYKGPADQITVKYDHPKFKGLIKPSQIKYISERDRP
jgi:dTDP-4-dehydrorhamnose 3,5-epimerase